MSFRWAGLVLATLLGACRPATRPAGDLVAAAPAPPPTPGATELVDAAEPASAGEFARQVDFLKRHGDVQLLVAKHGARVAVSAQYQGRVMTSAVSETGRGLGWINEKFIESKRTGTQFDNYGGEDRFWLGPEAGQFGLYFPAGKPFAFEHWQTPEAFQEGAWQVTEQSTSGILFEREMRVENYSGTLFELLVRRRIELIEAGEISSRLGVAVPSEVQWVAFQSENEIVNRGKERWNRQGGLLSIWILAMYPPSTDSWAILPYDKSAPGPVVNDSYFGKVPPERLKIDAQQGAIFFRCDGQHRSKLGLGYQRARSVLGSVSLSERLLTIVQYDLPKQEAPYVNSMWEHQKAPYRGDVVNAYNDGPTEPGKPALGGFYELETSSPGAELAPGASLLHTHRTFHFVGETAALEVLAKGVLGVSLGTLPE